MELKSKLKKGELTRRDAYGCCSSYEIFLNNYLIDLNQSIDFKVSTIFSCRLPLVARILKDSVVTNGPMGLPSW